MYIIQKQDKEMDYIRERGKGNMFKIKQFPTLEKAVHHIKHQGKLGIYKVIFSNSDRLSEILWNKTCDYDYIVKSLELKELDKVELVELLGKC